MRPLMLTEKSREEVFVLFSTREESVGFRASVICCHRNAQRASLVEKADAAALRAVSDADEK